MLNFEIRRSTRRCAETDRPLAPGESYVSAVVDEDGELVRRDFSLDAWDGPPEGCLAWWRNRIPERESGKVYWAPPDALHGYFAALGNQPDQAATRFVMALLLIQKRILRQLESETSQTLRLRHGKSGTDYEVAVVELTGEQKQTIQQELAEKLFTDEAPNADPSGEEEEGGDET